LGFPHASLLVSIFYGALGFICDCYIMFFWVVVGSAALFESSRFFLHFPYKIVFKGHDSRPKIRSRLLRIVISILFFFAFAHCSIRFFSYTCHIFCDICFSSVKAFAHFIICSGW
jgi:hypothetical protein